MPIEITTNSFVLSYGPWPKITSIQIEAKKRGKKATKLRFRSKQNWRRIEMMSLTLVCCYIIMGLCFLLFVNYKFLKLFITAPKYTHDANSNNSKITNQNINNNNVGDHPVQITTATMVTSSTANDVWSIPGPLRLPLFGTKWIYLWKYKMSKIHEVYRGEFSFESYQSPID